MRDESAADVEVAVADAAVLAELAVAFRTWPKPASLFEQFGRRGESGEIVVLVARTDGEVAGYCLVEWRSTYPPFAAASIPEIVDLNVLRDRQGRGAGRVLLDEAERLVVRRSDHVGLRVASTPTTAAPYGSTQSAGTCLTAPG